MKIIKAAIKINQDVYTGIRHADIYEELYQLKIPTRNAIEGFLTDAGNFVDRYEAKKIALAANQLIVPEEETYAALYSEDVW